jgi:hypothetical protein
LYYKPNFVLIVGGRPLSIRRASNDIKLERVLREVGVRGRGFVYKITEFPV